MAQGPGPAAQSDLTGMWGRGRGGGGGNANPNVVIVRQEQPGIGSDTKLNVRDGNMNYLEIDQEFQIKRRDDFPIYKPEHWEQVRYFEEFGYERPADPAFGCKNPGIVRLGAPAEIVQLPNKVILLYGGEHLWVREIPTDGRKLPDEADFEGLRITGTSVGRWDGNTLVIESSDFPADFVWYSTRGWFGSPNARITERFTLTGNSLRLERTIDDPAFQVPWQLDPITLTRNNNPAALLQSPLPCVERDAEHLPG